VRGEPTEQYAPQLRDPASVFAQATPMYGELSGAFVTCRFQSFAKADTFAGDDLLVRARFGTIPDVAAEGPEDANLGFVSAPLVTLRKDETVALEAYDRDVFSLSTLTKTSTKYQGAPVLLAESGATIECRSLSGGALQRVAGAKIAAADGAIGALRRHRLNTTGRSWGWPTERIEDVERTVSDVAALVGWDDARTTTKLAAREDALVALKEKQAGVFRELHESAKGEVAIGAVRATFDEIACDTTDDGKCLVKLTFQNSGKTRVAIGSSLSAQITPYVATPSSGPVGAWLEGGAMSVEIAPGESATRSLEAHVTGLGSDPAIVWLCSGTRCGALRIR
jgi:hypothetical protein